MDSEGRVATSFGDVTVSIAGIAAPLLYVSKNQINAVVPFEVEVRESVPIQARQGSVVLDSSVKVGPAHPAVFTPDSSGYGSAAVINQDGTINPASNPAAQRWAAVLCRLNSYTSVMRPL